MEALVLTNKTGKDVTTSLLIAEKFGKDHKNVLRDIQDLDCSPEFSRLNFEQSNYVNDRGKIYPMYEITKDGFSFLVMGYTGTKAAEFKEKFISEFNKRESLLKNDDYILEKAFSIMASRTKLLEAQIEAKNERLQLQEAVIKESAPKVMYFDEVLQSDKLHNTNVIAKDHGMSAITLNKILHEKKIIYRSGETWVLYHQFQDKGFTGTKTFIYRDSLGNERTSVQTYWTEKGREFIHQLMITVRKAELQHVN